MSLLHEIRNQPRHIRVTLWALSVFTTLAIAGYLWFTAIEREMFMALHSDDQERQEFLARQQDRMPKPLAAIGRAFGGMFASIGNLIGFDSSSGFDRSSQEDKVYLLPLSE